MISETLLRTLQERMRKLSEASSGNAVFPARALVAGEMNLARGIENSA
jgi:hypothetical protein